MYIFYSVLIIIVSILLILIVLVQNSKGGGLAAGFSSSNQYMGVRKTADFLEKATWTLAIVLVVLSILTTVSVSHGSNAPKAKIDDHITNTQDNSKGLDFPTTAPAKPAKPGK
jgi:preprotein translocase subunit SecG